MSKDNNRAGCEVVKIPEMNFLLIEKEQLKIKVKNIYDLSKSTIKYKILDTGTILSHDEFEKYCLVNFEFEYQIILPICKELESSRI